MNQATESYEALREMCYCLLTVRYVQLILRTPLPFLSPFGGEALILAPQR